MVRKLLSRIFGPVYKPQGWLIHSILLIAVLAILCIPAKLVSGDSAPMGAPPNWTANPPIIVRAPGSTSGVSPKVTTPSGYSPPQIREAYGINLLGSSGAGKTIAIIDAYGSPTVASDLQAFDQQFGLTTANLTIAYPNGKPGTNAGWALETSLDVEWAHSIASAAAILLVVAKSASTSNLLTAINYATTHGANVVSMSWGGTEFSGEASYDSYFDNSGITYVASSGDSGPGVDWPAVSPYVVGVGGTTLNLSNGTYVSEYSWSDSSGGTSVYEPKPIYQNGFQSSNYRDVPDVAFDADPNTGVAMYDTTPYEGESGWFEVGGTSVGAPCWAGLFVLGGLSGGLPLYSHASTTAYWVSNYNAVPTGAGNSYDPVTGLGSPKANNLVPGTAAKLDFITQPSANDTPGNTFPTQPVIAVQDVSGNTTTTSTASVTLGITPNTGTAGAALSGITTISAINGLVVFSNLSIKKAGTNYTLTVNGTGLKSAVSSSFNVTGKLTVDFDGDGKTDPAVYRPSTGVWYCLLSGTNYLQSPGQYLVEQWGQPGDIPVPGDYDGDGKTDLAFYRPSTGVWYILLSTNDYSQSPGQYLTIQWGQPGDIPVPGDYDGDGKTDPAVYRPSNGVWYILLSNNGYSQSPGQYLVEQWGQPGDIPVPGDYDGDGKTDPAVYRPSNGVWYALLSSTDYSQSSGQYLAEQWGQPSDTPIP